MLSTIAWILVMLMFVMIRFFGIDEENLVQVSGGSQKINLLMLLQGLLLGGMLGLSFSLMDVIIDKRVLRWVSYGQLIVLRSVGHVLVTLPVLGISVFLSHKILGIEDQAGWRQVFIAGPFSKSAIVLLVYTGFVTVMFNIIRQISSMFGPGIMLKLITGRYHHPVEEDRIFLFLDLKSSTSYAERLGHVLYSELIQDCFVDLTPAIRLTKADVYQYVGDEAVLTWRTGSPRDNNRCIHAYFAYVKAIRSRAAYYEEKYGLVPVFKAGANCGPVMAAEVGVVKREIAYHSDVLNTAARIQARCNDLEQPLLISEALRERLAPDFTFSTHEAGTFRLRGKRQESKLYGVSLERVSSAW